MIMILILSIMNSTVDESILNQHEFRFLLIQEEWVASQSKHLIVDKPNLVLNLGHPKYVEREKASEELRLMGINAWRYLVWAVYNKDAEISYRGYQLLLPYLQCEACHGSGNIFGDIFSGEGDDSVKVSFPCSNCERTGYIHSIIRKNR